MVLPIVMMLSTSKVIPSFLPQKNYLLHIFRAFYRRIRFSKTAHQDQTYPQQSLSFLVAVKCVGGTILLPEHGHINVLNRVGIWKVNEDIISIISVAEAYFLS